VLYTISIASYSTRSRLDIIDIYYEFKKMLVISNVK